MSRQLFRMVHIIMSVKCVHRLVSTAKNKEGSACLFLATMTAASNNLEITREGTLTGCITVRLTVPGLKI